MWTLETEPGDEVVRHIFNLVSPDGEIMYAGPDAMLALRTWHKTGAPWLEIKAGGASVYCCHVPDLT